MDMGSVGQQPKGHGQRGSSLRGMAKGAPRPMGHCHRGMAKGATNQRGIAKGASNQRGIAKGAGPKGQDHWGRAKGAGPKGQGQRGRNKGAGPKGHLIQKGQQQRDPKHTKYVLSRY